MFQRQNWVRRKEDEKEEVMENCNSSSSVGCRDCHCYSKQRKQSRGGYGAGHGSGSNYSGKGKCVRNHRNKWDSGQRGAENHILPSECRGGNRLIPTGGFGEGRAEAGDI